MRELIASGADVNIRDTDKTTALMLAARNGHLDCLKELIAANVNVNEKDREGATSLIMAAGEGHRECVKELIAAGALVSKWGRFGRTAFYQAVFHGHTKCVIELLASKAEKFIFHNERQTLIMLAAERGHVGCLNALISAGADVNMQDEDGKTALMTAANHGKTESLNELISAGAKVQKQAFNGVTALMIAAWEGHVDCLNALISAGADVNMQDEDGETALFKAARRLHMACLKTLVKHGAETNIRDTWDTTALEEAVAYGHVNVIRELIANGGHVAFINRCSAGGVPLINLIKLGNIESVKELINIGANSNITDEDGNTPLMISATAGNESIVQLLLDKGAEVNVKNKKGETALYLAVFHDHLKLQNKYHWELSLHGDISTHSKIVYTLLQGVAVVNDSLSDLNPATAHLMSKRLVLPNIHILKILLAAGADLEQEFFVSDKNLKNLTRSSIRKHLKQIYPQNNLYDTITQLNISPPLQSYLLFYMLMEVNNHLQRSEQDFLISTEDNAESVTTLIKTGADVKYQGVKNFTLVARSTRECPLHTVIALHTGMSPPHGNGSPHVNVPSTW